MALVQSFPQQPGSMTVVQSRPKSTGSLQAIGAHPSNHRDTIQRLGTTAYVAHPSHHRDGIQRLGAPNMAAYRGQAVGAPVAPYAFLNTPPLHQSSKQNAAWRQSLPARPQHVRSSSSGSGYQLKNGVQTLGRNHFSGMHKPDGSSADDSVGRGRPEPHVTGKRPKSAVLFPSGFERPPSASSQRSTHRPAERYRRRSSGPGAVPQIYNQPHKASSSPSLYAGSVRSRASSPSGSAHNEFVPPPVLSQQMRKGSMDDIFAQRKAQLEKAQLEKARRMRRQSVQSLDRRQFARSGGSPATSPSTESVPRSPFGSEAGDRPSIKRNNSSDTASVTSRPSSAHSRVPPRLGQRPASAGRADPSVPDRSSSNKKRMTMPSPLSRPVTSDGVASQQAKRASAISKLGPPRFFSPDSRSVSESIPPPNPSQEAAKKGFRSRLRRAFSFSSSSELRRAAVDNKKQQDIAAQRNKLSKDKPSEAKSRPSSVPEPEVNLDEMAPPPVLDGGIYRNRSGSFTGSTDNFSISSTASSASIIMRKMGKSMRRTSKSIKGIFRNKNGEFVEGDDLERQAIEAECEVVNVNYDVTENPAGETDYPRLERNSMDAASVSAVLDLNERPISHEDRSRSLRNLVTGERADGTLIIPKGILKRAPGSESGNSSPVTPPEDSRAPELTALDTPSSSRPETPADDVKTDNVAIANDDYFTSPHAAHAANSQPAMKYNVSFNSRLQFHDTWPSMEYDRRGEVATCNRLTPLLAQQIKEELNTFKMEMEVHESSKMYTHFF